MTRFIIALIAVMAVSTLARSDGLGNYGILGQGEFGGIGGSLTAPAPPAANSLLLEDGTSFLLLEDNSSHLCLEGGC